MRREYVLNPGKIARVLVMVACYLALQSIIAEYILEKVIDSNQHPILSQVLDLASVNAESTLPTWFSILILFFAAVLLGIIAFEKWTTKAHFRWHWIGLALIFLYLSIDEGVAIHEIASDVVEETLHTTGFLYFGWQVVAAPIVLIFAGFYLRFLLHLPTQMRYLVLLAGIIYVGGASGIESISANQYYHDGSITILYLAIGTLEELAEMLGIVLFIYALLVYVSVTKIHYVLSFSTSVYTLAFDRDQANQSIISEVPSASPGIRWFRRGGVLAVVFTIGMLIGLIGILFTQQQDTTLLSLQQANHTIQVIETAEQERYLTIDGIPYLSNTAPYRIEVLGTLPISLLQPQNTLFIGERGVQIPFRNTTTILASNPSIYGASLLYFGQTAQPTWTTVFDDPLLFLTREESKEYDLISIDYQEMGAYTSETFYQIVHQHLSKTGLFITPMTERFQPASEATHRQLEALWSVFDQVMVITLDSEATSFVYASQQPLIDQTSISTAIDAIGEEQFVVLSSAAVKALTR